MDWSRAKTILIWAFLFLDLFLGYQVYASQGEEWKNTEAVQGEKWDIELYVKQQNIKLLAEIPQETPEMKYLNVEYYGVNALALQEMTGQKITIEKSSILSQLAPPMLIDKQTGTDELLQQLSSRLQHADQYKVDSYLSTPQRLHYWQTHEKLPIFIAPLEVFVDNQLVRGYQQTYFHIRSQGSGRQVISAYTALRSLVEKQIILPGEQVENVSLGYYGYHYDADIQVLAPVWRFIHNGSIEYINGFTGAIERPLDEIQLEGQ